VRSCDLEGKNITTQVRDLRLDSFTWTTPGRFIYSRTTDPGGTVSDKLFELRVDNKGVPQAQSQLLTDWSGFAAFNFSSSSDGRHMAFLRGGERIAMYVAELAQDRNRTLNSQSFNPDENLNIPLAWTPDSKEVIFSSKRADRRLIYKLNIDQKTPAQLVTNSPGMNFYLARATPDGTAIIFEGLPSSKEPIFSLYRAELDGANPRLLFHSHSFVNYGCTGAKKNFCVLGDMSSATNELVITRFDPNSGEKHETLRIALDPGTSARIGGDYVWQLAPDGLSVAILKRHSGSIRLVPLNHGATRLITVDTQSDLQELNWAADSHSLFVSGTTADNAVVYHVDMTGKTRPITQDHGATYMGALPSPDGKRLVIWSDKIEANAWIIDDF
jgi:Tol biopolymer transport system component